MADYERVDEALEEAAVQAAEAHGVLTGMLCAKGAVGPGAWIEALGLQDKAPEPLRMLYAKTLASFQDVTGSFDLLLPEDEAPMEERAAALHDWCQGFLYGFGVAGGREPASLPAEAGEVLRDIGEFARASFALGEDAEEDEQAYSELVEYLRVGVLLLYEALHPRDEAAKSPAKNLSKTLH